jgi:AraC family transcriptional regulator
MRNYKQILQKAVEYIEVNLGKEMELEMIGDYVGLSLYHFMRTFSAFTGYTLKQYIRVRRLSEAATELVTTSNKVKELASKYCFQSSESFIRAFAKQFRMTPNEYRKNDQLIHYVPKLKIQSVKTLGGNSVNYKIKEMPELTIIGLKRKVKHQDGSIPKLWDEFVSRFPELQDFKNAPVIGLCFHDPRFVDKEPSEHDEFWYMPGFIVNNLENIPEDFTIHKVNAAKYAVFTHKGSVQEMGNTYRYISCEWIQKVDYEWALADEFEWYDDRFKPNDPENSEIDIYIPIK